MVKAGIVGLLLLVGCGSAPEPQRSSGEPLTGVCEPGYQACNGLVATGCLLDGTWAPQLSVRCPYACVEGDGCVGVCVPGDAMTDGNNAKHTCDAQGSWQPPLM